MEQVNVPGNVLFKGLFQQEAIVFLQQGLDGFHFCHAEHVLTPAVAGKMRNQCGPRHIGVTFAEPVRQVARNEEAIIDLVVIDTIPDHGSAMSFGDKDKLIFRMLVPVGLELWCFIDAAGETLVGIIGDLLEKCLHMQKAGILSAI